MEDKHIEEIVIQIRLTEHISHLRAERGYLEGPKDLDPVESNKIVEDIKSEANKLGAEILESRGDVIHSEPSRAMGEASHKTRKVFDSKKEASIPGAAVNMTGVDYITKDQLALIFGSSGVLITYLTAIRPVLVQWLKNRASRSVTVKHGDTEINISGSNDIDEAIKVLKTINSKRKKLP